MSMPKVRTYFGGANADTPSVVDDWSDIRTTSYSNIYDIPRDENGDAPTCAYILITIEDSSATTNGSGGMNYKYPAGTGGLSNRIGYGCKDPWGGTAQLQSVSGHTAWHSWLAIPPGATQLRVVNGVSTDPGHAVPAKLKIWWYKGQP